MTAFKDTTALYQLMTKLETDTRASTDPRAVDLVKVDKLAHMTAGGKEVKFLKIG